MSFQGSLRSAPPRSYRSKLFVPGSEFRLFAKAAASAADSVCLDLEDSVAPADKERARVNIVEAMRNIDWHDKFVSCRINGLDTPWWYRDVIALLEESGNRLDALMVPKVGSGADLHAVDVLAMQAGRVAGRVRPIELEAQIETALGVVNLDDIATTSPRLTSLHFGHADYGVSMGMRLMEIGGDSADYVALGEADATGARARHSNDAWHYPLVRMVTTARARGLLAIEGPYGDFGDKAGLSVYAKRAAALGCTGKWAIHPGQIETINAAFSPSPAAIARARAIVAAMQEAQDAGRGAVSLNGVLIDMVGIRQAEQILAMAGSR